MESHLFQHWQTEPYMLGFKYTDGKSVKKWEDFIRLNKMVSYQGAWVAQLVKRPVLALVTISRCMSSSPAPRQALC